MPPVSQGQAKQQRPSGRSGKRHNLRSKLPFAVADPVASTGRTVLVPSKAVVFVYAGLVVTGVTACAIGLVAWGRPADHFRVVLMALGAQEVVAMILRLIRESRVPVVGRYPRIRAVAQTTVLHSIEMARILPGGLRPIVAGRTGAENLVVIDRRYRRPNRRVVTILANIRR